LCNLAQCLYTLTDDNPDCRVVFVKNPDYVKPFMAILSTNVEAEEELLIKTLACGIVINLRFIISPKAADSDFSDIHNAVLPVLSSALNFDLQKASVEAAAAAQVAVCLKHFACVVSYHYAGIFKPGLIQTNFFSRTHKSKKLTCQNQTSQQPQKRKLLL